VPYILKFVTGDTGTVVTTRVSTDSEWSCTRLDTRGRATNQTFAAFGSAPERTVTTNWLDRPWRTYLNSLLRRVESSFYR
jgi:enoyl reductase-like protein